MNVVIIGAVALGPKTACRLKRLKPGANVLLVDRDRLISYGGCGIPYYVSGDVADASQLQSTSFHMLRDESFFKNAKDVRVLTRTEAVAIDRRRKNVLVRNLDSGEEQELPYDKLVLATGARAHRLPIPGADQEGVFTVSSLNEAISIKNRLTTGKMEKAVVIGAGAIGLEMAEAFSDLWGVETAVVEIQDQILPGVADPNVARMAQKHMEENNVRFHLGETIQAIERRDSGLVVVTDQRSLETDAVIMAVGFRPNSDLARDAGLEVTPRGGIVVNSRMETSDPDIYAGGDCIEVKHLLTGKRFHLPSGSLANRQGRIIGTNVAGGNATFEGVVGSFIVKLFEISFGSVGLNEKQAKAEGFDPVSAFVVQGDRAHFYPEMELMYLQLIVDRKTRRVLGLQGIGAKNDALAARIDAVAAILKYQPTIEDISNLEVAYAPPFSAAMDILNAVANTADNILAEKNRILNVDEFDKLFQCRHDGDFIFLDVRGPQNAQPYVERYPACWINIPQDELRERMAEVPKDKKLILVCNSGVRSYEAQITLEDAGIGNTRNLQGGVAALKKWGIHLTE
ncbi:MAG: FAD-dependent oxidoreductase [Deltaproteobacteria bacterium]|nr:FAD-dependent oxidoreductase [Deltaproteobacteria bacterium]